MNTQQIATRPPMETLRPTQTLVVQGDMPLADLGSILAKSGFFADVREAGQAIVKVLAGRELGFGPIASMTGINIIKGRVSISANLMAAAVKRTTKYNYRIVSLSDERCELVFYEGGQEVGKSAFTAADAKRAGTQNMDRFPRNILFSRAMSNGCKWYCADVFGGPVYTPEELGMPVDEDGEMAGSLPAPKPASSPAEPAPVVDPRPARDYTESEIGPAFDTPTPARPTSKLWERWYTLVREAEALGLAHPNLDEAADDMDIVKAGKALGAVIRAAKANWVAA